MIEIIHLKHNEIDKNKWDRVVASSNFALPYFFSWYFVFLCYSIWCSRKDARKMHDVFLHFGTSDHTDIHKKSKT